MNQLQRLTWGLMITTNLCLGSALCADEPAGVIADQNWKIEIRPADRSWFPAASQATPQIVEAAYQEDAPAPAPVNSDEPAETTGPSLSTDTQPVAAPAMIGTAPKMTYAQAYSAVPFSRTEYEANPAYRHQAAVELMFGVLRPTTLVQQYTPRASRFGDEFQVPYGRSGTQHINIRQFGGGYYNGQSPFGYPYGLHGNW